MTRSRAALASMGWLLALVPGCEDNFKGPYPCNVGYASCTTPDQCETNITSDPHYCGGCGAEFACPQGAVCASGVCGPAPETLATDVVPSTLVQNNSTLYWSLNQNVVGLPKDGSPRFTISTPNRWEGGNGSWATFAVDNSSVYFPAFAPTSSGASLVVESVSASGASAAPSLIGTLADQNVGIAGVLLSGGSLFVGINANTGGSSNNLSIVSGPKAGGVFSALTTFPNSSSSFAVDDTHVYVMDSCDIYGAPASGGAPALFVSSRNLGCPSAMKSDGNNLYWASSFTEYSNNNGSNATNNRCLLRVFATPVSGGAADLLSTMEVDETPLQVAFDAEDVYVATNASVWRVPIGGGTATRVAGNLGANIGGQQTGGSSCAWNGGPQSSATLGLAVDPTDVYIAVTSTTGPTLLRIPK